MDEENKEQEQQPSGLGAVLAGPGSLGSDTPMSPEEREARNVDPIDDTLDLGMIPFAKVAALATTAAIMQQRQAFLQSLGEDQSLTFAPWSTQFLVPVDVVDEVLEEVADKFSRHVAGVYASSQRPMIGTATARELGPEYLTENPEAGFNQFMRVELRVEYGPEGLIGEG